LAVGGKPELPEPITSCAADKILGPLATKLAHDFDKKWWKSEKSRWVNHHQNYCNARGKIKTLSEKPLTALSVPDLQELAFLKLDYETPESAKPVLAHMLKRDGGPFSKAEFEYGCILLKEENDTGLDHLKTAAKADQSLHERVAEIGYSYLYHHRSDTAAHTWWEQVTSLHQ